MSSKLSMRVATHALIAGLAITSGGIGAVSVATPAFAAPGDTSIDTSRTGSLTIHKRLSDNPDDWVYPSTGEVVADPAGDPLKGAEFTIQMIDLDFNDPAKIKEAAELTPAEAEGKLKDGTATAAETGDDGVAAFENLPVGAYLVKETVTPQGKVGVKPFIAYVPMTAADRKSWNYDIHAYPKNTPDVTVTKALSERLPEGGDAAKKNGEANVGDEIAYDVTSTRPVINKDRSFVKYFSLYDVVPTGLTYVNEDAKQKLTIGDEGLTKGNDYTVTEDTVDGQKYVFYTLTKAGNEKLTNAASDAEVVGTFTFTVDPIADGDKSETTTNKGGVIHEFGNKIPDPNNPDGPGTTPTDPGDYPDPDPTNPPAKPNPNPTDPNNPDNPESPGVDATWIKLDFKKKNSTDAPVAGAKFNVYRCTKTGAENGLDKGDSKAVLGDQVLTKQGPEKNGVFVSGNDGKVTINALRLRDDALRGADDGYCIVETEAPAGYELLPSPYFVRLTAEDAKRTADFNFEVENTRSVGPKLPATGGMGVGILAIVGAAIIGAGAFFARRNGKTQA